MATRGGAVHVATTKRVYKGKTYVTHLLRRSLRKGKTVTQTQAGGQPALTRTVTRTQTQPTVEVRTKTVTTTSPASVEGEARAREAETNLRKAERENEQLRRQAEGGAAP